MTYTMADLRREVADRLRDTLHGKEIDTMEKGMPRLPHMLGIVTIGAISTHEAIAGSILDPDHEFWSNYYKDVDTLGMAEREVESAVRSLQEDNIFRVTNPYGEEAGISYCEIGEVDNPPNEMVTTCAECGGSITTQPELSPRSADEYFLEFHLDCTECSFEDTFRQSFITV